MNKILLVDYFNILKRYMTYKEDIDNGTYIDLTVDLIVKTLSRTISKFSPDLVVVCMDNGKNKRAIAINPNYKANRGKARSLITEEREKDKIEFAKNVVEIFPVIKIEQPNTEADQIIYFIYKYLFDRLEDTTFIIASNDSDFVQLLSNENVILYDWVDVFTKENFHLSHKYLNEFVNINNFAIAKSIVGDTSDNIKGLKGVGWKTVINLFNLIDPTINIESLDHLLKLIPIARERQTDKKKITFLNKMENLIKENKDTLFKNQQLIDLSFLESPYIVDVINQFKNCINHEIIFNKFGYKDLLNNDMYLSKFDTQDNNIINKNYYYNLNNFIFQEKRTKKFINNMKEGLI